MSPALNHGDYIIAAKLPFSTFKLKDVIIVKHPVYSEIIKRIDRIDNRGNYWLKGDGLDTLSSEKIGPIQECQIIAKMIYHIKPKSQG